MQIRRVCLLCIYSTLSRWSCLILHGISRFLCAPIVSASFVAGGRNKLPNEVVCTLLGAACCFNMYASCFFFVVERKIRYSSRSTMMYDRNMNEAHVMDTFVSCFDATMAEFYNF